jgi:hypothetical protein
MRDSGYTFFPKNPSTKFVVKNIAPFRKRIRVFNYPIANGATRDLLAIPEISEATIRHSLLKGELVNKFRCGELVVIDSDIDLLQFNDDQKSFLVSIGITKGLEITVSATADIPYVFKQEIPLIGVKDGVNSIFTTPDIFINDTFLGNEFHILIRHNGRGLIEGADYVLLESGGVGTGFDTIVFTGMKIKSKSELVADYVVSVT